MSVELVFNELSLRRPVQDKPAARRVMTEFIATVRLAAEIGVPASLRAEASIHDLLIAPDYPVARWRNDPEVDREERQYFRLINSKVPPLTDLPDVAELLRLQDFRYEDDAARGLGVAELIGGLAVSLATDESWAHSAIQIEVSSINAQEELQSSTAIVEHASRTQHVETHRPWIRIRLNDELEDGKAIWLKRDEIYPRLVLCHAIEDQLADIDAGSILVRSIKHRLEQLNIYCSRWLEGPFNSRHLGFHASQESQATLQQYGGQRTIRCPDGQDQLFSWHCRLPGAWRLHFLPRPTNRTIIVGYIGPHLPTIVFRN